MQAQEPVSIHLTEKGGLPDKEFYTIAEDSKGYIWLCADKGLFKYDGKTYKHYTNKNQRGLSTFNVQEDSKGTIWCNNISGQFFFVENNELTLFIDLKTHLKGELTDFVIKNGYLWVFSTSKVYQVNLVSQQISVIIREEKSLGVPLATNNSIYFQSKDSISSISANNTIKHLLATNLPLRTKNNTLSIGQGKSNIFKLNNKFFLTQNRLSLNTFFQFNNNSFKRANGLEVLATTKIYTFFEKDTELWIGTSTGVWVYEYVENKFKLKKRFFKNVNITKIIKDKDDNYWFTTLNSGLYIIPNIHIETTTLSPKNKNISSLDKINDSTLVFGLTNGNIGLYNTKKHTNTIINLPNKDRVSSLIYHPSDKIIVSKDLSSYVWDLKAKKYNRNSYFFAIKSFSIIANNSLLYTNYSSTRLIKTEDIELSSKDYFKKVKFIDRGKRTYASYYHKKNNEVFVSNVDGLVVYDSVWNTTTIQHKNTSIYGKSISKTTNGIIWVATFKNGVFGIKNKKVIAHYTVSNGLTSNNIEKIAADKNNLWIALNNSIQVLNVSSKEIKTLTKNDGILSYDISGIEIFQDKIYFSSNEGLFSVDKEKSFKQYNPQVYYNQVQINEKDTIITSSYNLKYNQNSIKFGFNVNGLSYNKKGTYQYRLKGYNDTWLVTDLGVNTVKYNSLPAGNFTFEVKPIITTKNKKNTIQKINLTINLPFWKTWWFLILISLVVISSIILYFKKKIKTKEKERIAQLEKLSLEKELIAINLIALRSQMNPHFIFNALNSIQDLVLKQDTNASYDSIVLFAELIRNALSYSNQDFIAIDKELRFLDVYLQLEKLRFGNDFDYNIDYPENQEVMVPSLLVQPFIENSLVHGLLHKAGAKELSIKFNLTNNVLQCIITDNGIGRVKAKEISNRQGNPHESFALGAIEKRLEIFKKQYHQNIGYSIEDLYAKNIAKGTRVVVTMPYKKNY